MSKTIAIILSTIVSIWSSGPGNKSFVDEATIANCENIQRNFPGRLKFIAQDNDITSKRIDSSFHTRYLSGLKELNRGKRQSLYYHSVPDIQTDMCLVIVKSVVKDEKNPFTQFQNEYSYYLVDLTNDPKVILELARFEETPDTQRRVYSNFIDDKTLIQTDVREYLIDHDGVSNSYRIQSDSSVSLFAIEAQRFKSIKGDGTMSIKKRIF